MLQIHNALFSQPSIHTSVLSTLNAYLCSLNPQCISLFSQPSIIPLFSQPSMHTSVLSALNSYLCSLNPQHLSHQVGPILFSLVDISNFGRFWPIFFCVQKLYTICVAVNGFGSGIHNFFLEFGSA